MPDKTPTTAASQAPSAPLRVVVPRRPTPHHLSGTIIGRARTHLAASAPAACPTAARVRAGARVRGKGHRRDLRRQEPAADPANRRGDPPRAGQTGEITAEVAAAQEPSRAAGGSDGPPRPPRADNRPCTTRPGTRTAARRALASPGSAGAPELEISLRFSHDAAESRARCRRRTTTKTGSGAPRDYPTQVAASGAPVRAAEEGARGAGRAKNPWDAAVRGRAVTSITYTGVLQFAWLMEPHRPPLWPCTTPEGCRGLRKPTSGVSRWVACHPDVRRSRPHVAWASHEPRRPVGQWLCS